jgi:hypothetical protein
VTAARRVGQDESDGEKRSRWIAEGKRIKHKMQVWLADKKQTERIRERALAEVPGSRMHVDDVQRESLMSPELSEASTRGREGSTHGDATPADSTANTRQLADQKEILVPF